MNTVIQEQSIFHHQGNKIITTDCEISIITKMKQPCIVILDNVLTSGECDHLIQLSKERMQRSKIGTSRDVTDMRTSSSTFLSAYDHPIIEKIEKRIAHIMCIPYEHGEGLQVLHYQVGQEYKAHFDFFSPTSKAHANPRISTLVMYLSDVEEGGETYFPHLHLSVSPKKGMAVYFEYFYDNQQLNELTLHGSAPVIQGDKWAVTQWMHRQQIR